VPQLRSLRSLSPGCLSKPKLARPCPYLPVVVLVAVLAADCACRFVCRMCVERAAVPPPRSHSQGCNTLVAVAIATPRFWVRNRFTRIPVARTEAVVRRGLWPLQPRSSLSNFFSAGDTVAQSLYRWMVIDGGLSRLAFSGPLRQSHMQEDSTGSPHPLKSG
jgi:hypothetical protein